MEPVFFVMAILGCGDGNAGCAEARVAPLRYATMAACRADQANVLARSTDVSAPVVGTACRASGPMIVSKKPAPSV